MKMDARERKGTSSVERPGECSIVALDRFIQATRDSGYKGTPSAIAELVDNSLEAGATRIAITIARTPEGEDYPLEVSVLDDGCGMDPFTLRQAMRFGGSTRFNGREGLGRFGMGLPNSSFSQARRVTVYTWQQPGDVFATYLDVDEIADGTMTEVPPPAPKPIPCGPCPSDSGTLVLWSRCDRLDNRRPSTVARKLSAELGQRFRHYLWDGIRIEINGVSVEPYDPLYIHPESAHRGATVFGEPMIYEVAVDPGRPHGPTGQVVVTFSELPVRIWYKRSNKEKRSMGLATGAGVSVVRAKREVDYGWFFMGGKRKENYDDWWRCEVRFDPDLDEAFGITHTKQQVRPNAMLQEILSADMESMARVLNNRARRAHLAARAAERFSDSERVASDCERHLKPLHPGARGPTPDLFQGWQDEVRSPAGKSAGASERLVTMAEMPLKGTGFFTYERRENTTVAVLNPDHPFYKKVYRLLIDSESELGPQLRTHLELLLLAFARAGLANTKENSTEVLSEQLQSWSSVLATYHNK